MKMILLPSLGLPSFLGFLCSYSHPSLESTPRSEDLTSHEHMRTDIPIVERAEQVELLRGLRSNQTLEDLRLSKLRSTAVVLEFADLFGGLQDVRSRLSMGGGGQWSGGTGSWGRRMRSSSCLSPGSQPEGSNVFSSVDTLPSILGGKRSKCTQLRGLDIRGCECVALEHCCCP